MRIIAGKYKSRILQYPKSKDLRPTQDRVRESLFSMINTECHHATVLDAFAGTGSFGLEALSRGADSAVFVDTHIDYLKKNVQILDDTDQARVKIKKSSALSFIKQSTDTFDIILLDPPWNKADYFDLTLKAIFDFGIINPNGLIICEHPATYSINDQYNILKIKTMGNTSLTLIKPI
ncbi:16S rRNA (guanine(966)-N(2))-methyltransferase RsmD [Candidatus Marinamargulisbacteria bacterium SCGC AG-414-C22]|nr:16S rRNA (guanine(966)-N(2))-methyltransferase RsmD [Candidatus Marinamargulisbacteria bacterium SCGC AG-414-C22]